MSLNQRLTELVQFIREHMLGWKDSLTPSELEEVGEEKKWSVKDELFHNIIWANRRMTILETLERGESWTNIDYGDDEDENLMIFEEHKQKSWEEAQDLLNDCYHKILDYINRTDETTLRTKPKGQDREIWHSIAGSYVMHPMIHLWGYLAKKGDISRLTELFGEGFAHQLLDLNDSDEWQAGVYYNLACIQALTGKKKESIKQLKQALKKNPKLMEWARQDSDLESIREEPDFQALVNIEE